MNIPRSFSFCSNHVFPAITDNDFKMAHLGRVVTLFAAFPRQEQQPGTWEAVTLGWNTMTAHQQRHMSV